MLYFVRVERRRRVLVSYVAVDVLNWISHPFRKPRTPSFLPCLTNQPLQQKPFFLFWSSFSNPDSSGTISIHFLRKELPIWFSYIPFSLFMDDHAIYFYSSSFFGSLIDWLNSCDLWMSDRCGLVGDLEFHFRGICDCNSLEIEKKKRHGLFL